MSTESLLYQKQVVLGRSVSLPAESTFASFYMRIKLTPLLVQTVLMHALTV